MSSFAFVDAAGRRPERPGSLFRLIVVAAAAAGAVLGTTARVARRRRS